MNRMMRRVLVVGVFTVLLPWAGCVALAADEGGEQKTGAETGTAGEQPVLRTQQFESGELRLPEVESERLEAFLRDLNRRRDYDFSQHGGHPGPDHAYLTAWVRRVVTELKDRGYYFDEWGDLRRPGSVVLTR